MCSNLVGVPALELPVMMRVTPGDSASSYLFCKLDPDCAARPAGATLMPVGLPGGLPAEDLAVVAGWIDAGAPGCIDAAAPVFAGATQATARPSAVELSWSPASDDITPASGIVYLAYQAAAPGAEDFAQPTAESAPGATSMTISGLANSTTYHYVVRARDGAGNIDQNTVEVSATTPDTGDASAPTFAGLASATPVGSTSVHLTWQPATDDATPQSSIVYRVYTAQSAGAEDFGNPALETAPGQTDALLSGLAVTSEYFFVVRSVDLAGNEDQNTVERAATTNDAVSFSANVLPILSGQCTNIGCHGGVMPAQELDLRAPSAYADLVDASSTQCTGLTRVTPGDLGASYLVNKLTGMGMCFGTRMPKGSVMSAADRQWIFDWIAQGAPNN